MKQKNKKFWRTFKESEKDPDDIYSKIFFKSRTTWKCRADFLFKELESVEDKIILDLGAGIGLHTNTLIKKKATVISADISSVMLQEIKNRDRVLLNAPSLPFSEGSFDIVLCASVFLYFRDLDSVIKETGRVLKDDGKLVFTTLNSEWTLKKIKRIRKIKTKLIFHNKKEVEIILIKNGFIPELLYVPVVPKEGLRFLRPFMRHIPYLCVDFGGTAIKRGNGE